MSFKNFKEKLSIYVAKNPRRTILLIILLFNILFILASAGIISLLSLDGTEHMNFMRAAFCTITMILDAGCVQYVVEDIGSAGVMITMICLLIIMIGMISFTAAVIGYISNAISEFISNANAGNRKLNISEHVVILNWNTRASEIINDLMYCEEKKVVVVLAKSNKAEIEKEIHDRLTDTIERENAALKEHGVRFAKNIDDKVTVIVREGDVFSSGQLQNIALERARTIIILGDEYTGNGCAYQRKERRDEVGKGNAQTVKTLMQVADITSSASSFDDQKVIVEITDNWTWEIVSRIKEYKQINEECNIVPVRVNRLLGQLLSQFSIMPELNMVYKELLSNKGVEFYYRRCKEKDGDMMLDYMINHDKAIPVSYVKDGEDFLAYYVAAHEENYDSVLKKDYGIDVDFNANYKMECKHVIILGHNSKALDIMDGFAAFQFEWGENGKKDVIDVLVIDDEKSLERMNYYNEYSFVKKTVAADIYERELICSKISEYVSQHEEDTSILILSDDTVSEESIDSQALANLVYVQDIIFRKKKENPDFDEHSMDMIVEIIDPKHHDIVSSYSVDNVVISNRYISKMITQIGEKDYLFDFYKDILTYDTDLTDGFDSMEIYTKRASKLFNTIPEKCPARALIQGVYRASVKENNPTVILGYINGDGMHLFGGDLDSTEVEIMPNDLIVVYSNH